MMAALKPVSDNSNICYLSIAMYLFIYFTQLEILLFLSVMNDFFFNWNPNNVGVMLGNSGSQLKLLF